MSYICHIMNVVPPCETSNSEMRSPCETYTAKPCSQCNAGAPGPRDARDALANRCWASTSLDVSGLVQSCPGCNMSAVQEFTYADATFISFISFPLPGTFCRAATRYPASSLIGRAVKPSRPPNQWWMHGD